MNEGFPNKYCTNIARDGDTPWILVFRWKDSLDNSTAVSLHHNIITVDIFALLGQEIFQKLGVEWHLL